MGQAIGEHVGVYLVAVFDLVASATTTALHVGRVVQPFGAVDQDDPAVDSQAFQLRGAAVLQPDGLDIVNGFEQRVVQGNLLELFVGKDLFELAPE